MKNLMEMFDEDLKELAKLIAQRQGRKCIARPTETVEVRYEEEEKDCKKGS